MHDQKTLPTFKLALVTGASSGIGTALCHILAAKGISLIITGRDAVHLEELVKNLSSHTSVSVIIADLAKKPEVARVVAQIHAREPDLIVNCAGFGLYGEALSYSTEEQIAILNVNALALLELTLEGARTLRAANKKGVIMNVSSAADRFVYPLLAVYSASKAFVTQFSRSFDAEMRPKGVAILVACPGVVNTQFRLRASRGKIRGENEGYFAMSKEFAAKELWKQIEARKQVHVFDWKTRLGIFLSYFIQTKMVSKLLARAITNSKNIE